MKKLLFALVFCLVSAGAQAQTIMVGMTFHYASSDDCPCPRVYMMTALGNVFSQTCGGLVEFVSPVLVGNFWGEESGPPPEIGPCEFLFVDVVLGTGDVFRQTRLGIYEGAAPTYLGTFWGPYTATEPTTWGKLKSRKP